MNDPAAHSSSRRGLRVTFLGSGDAFGSGGRHQACIAVEGEGRTYLLDCGATALVSMGQLAFDTGAIGAILVTHLHGDHFGGLPFYLLQQQFLRRRATPLVVAGPEGTADRVAAAAEALFPSLMAHRTYPLEYVAWRDREPVSVAGAMVTPFAVQHPSGATPFALRVELAGKVICYSGDTEWTPALAEAARDSDLLVVECTSFERRVPAHLSYRTLLAHRAELMARRVVLTHLGPDALAHRGDLDEWEIAHDGLVLTW
jgi:ribonuclease BN (tRNA processing enzyme)